MKKWYGACFWRLGEEDEQVYLFTDTKEPGDIWDKEGWLHDKKIVDEDEAAGYTDYNSIYVEIEIEEEP